MLSTTGACCPTDGRGVALFSSQCKQMFTLLDVCVSFLRRGHANLLCIVLILMDDPRRESAYYMFIIRYYHYNTTPTVINYTIIILTILC